MKLFLLLLAFTVFENSRAFSQFVCYPGSYFKLNAKTCRCDYDGRSISCLPETICKSDTWFLENNARCKCSAKGDKYSCIPKSICEKGMGFVKNGEICMCSDSGYEYVCLNNQDIPKREKRDTNAVKKRDLIKYLLG